MDSFFLGGLLFDYFQRVWKRRIFLSWWGKSRRLRVFLTCFYWHWEHKSLSVNKGLQNSWGSLHASYLRFSQEFRQPMVTAWVRNRSVFVWMASLFCANAVKYSLKFQTRNESSQDSNVFFMTSQREARDNYYPRQTKTTNGLFCFGLTQKRVKLTLTIE